MSYSCEYCSTKFTNKYNLQVHMKNAKYCLKNRGIETTDYVCMICQKALSSKKAHRNHVKICKVKSDMVPIMETKIQIYQMLVTEKNNLLSEKDKVIARLESRLENIAIELGKKPTTTNILNMKPLTDDWLKEQAQYLTQDVVRQGIEGYARFAVENSFKDRVVCTDFSRRKLKFKSPTKGVTNDNYGVKLAKRFFTSIKDKNDNYIQEIREEIEKQISSLESKTSIETRFILSRMSDLIKLEKGVIRMTKGEEEELRADFVRRICTLLPEKICD